MKILVAEDDHVTRRILVTYLAKWGYEAIVAADGQQAWELLQKEDAPRLAILDWMMPGRDGTSICRQVRKLNLQPYIYLILLTARGFKQDIIEGLEAGADEYLTKPFDPYELKARLRSGARIVELQDNLIKAREALRDQAIHDPLTHLLNRRATMDFLLSELNRSDREKRPLSVMMIDIDLFKSVNDRFGHLVGDEVLCEVGRRLRKSARTYDAVGRFGGEEFLVVAPGCGTVPGLSQAERLREVISSQPITLKDLSVKVTISVGVATTLDPNWQGMEPLLSAADQALYRAKAGGRNRVEGEPSGSPPPPKPDPPQGSVAG